MFYVPGFQSHTKKVDHTLDHKWLIILLADHTLDHKGLLLQVDHIVDNLAGSKTHRYRESQRSYRKRYTLGYAQFSFFVDKQLSI